MNRLLMACALVVAGCGQPRPGPRSRFSTAEALAARNACSFGPGTLAGPTLDRDAPLGSEIAIDTFVIVMMENRSFDHIFGDLKARQPDADVAPLDASNPDRDGTPVARFRLTDFCPDDPAHDWTPTHVQWNGGKMDGFVVTNNAGGRDGKRAMGYHTSRDLPFINAIAAEFALADRAFCSLLGPTFPNRGFLAAGTNYGVLGDELHTEPRFNLIEVLQTAKVSWRDYYTNLPTLGLFLESFTRNLEHSARIDQFFVDAAGGGLAQINFVDPDLAPGNGALKNDMHPPGNPQLGDEFLERVIRAVMNGPQWKRAAVIVMFDEHGGFYDHAPPPPACPPDAIDPILQAGDTPAKFDRLGIRVPLIVVSPFAKRKFVSHDVYDHTSVLKLLEARFNLPAMTARDANADGMLNLFDFKRPDLSIPLLPSVTIDAAEMSRCAQKFPPMQ